MFFNRFAHFFNALACQLNVFAYICEIQIIVIHKPS